MSSLRTFLIVSSVFLTLYVLVLIALALGFRIGRLPKHSRWTVLFLHVAVRLSAQAVGLTFSLKPEKDSSLLIAYIVLSAEGLFILLVCTLRCLLSWQAHTRTSERQRAWLDLNITRRWTHASMLLSILLVANILVIAAGCIVNNDGGTLQPNTAAKALRTTGASILLASTLVLTACAWSQHPGTVAGQYAKPAQIELHLLFAAMAFLIVRGVFGVCQSTIADLNYYDERGNAFATSSLIADSICQLATEWLACVMLCSTAYLRPLDKGLARDACASPSA